MSFPSLGDLPDLGIKPGSPEFQENYDIDTLGKEGVETSRHDEKGRKGCQRAMCSPFIVGNWEIMPKSNRQIISNLSSSSTRKLLQDTEANTKGIS